MLEKMGKTDLGETAKSIGIVFVVGMLVAVVGGMLTVMLDGDETGYGSDSGGGDGTAQEFVGLLHREGKSFVGLVSFWSPIAGLLMILSAGIILRLGPPLLLPPRRRAAAAFLPAACAAPAAAALVAAGGAVPLHAVAALLAAALAADAFTTARSGRYPLRELNPAIRLLHGRLGAAAAWAAYAALYAAAAAASHALLSDWRAALAVMASLHMAAAALNAASERAAPRRGA